MAITTAVWTSPITWTANLAITVGRLNNFIGTGPTGTGGNLQYLYDNTLYATSGGGDFFYTPSANYSVNGQAGLVVVDGAHNVRISMTTNLAKLIGLWMFWGAVDNTAHTATGWWTTLLDGTAQDHNVSGSTLVQNEIVTGSGVAFPMIVPFYYSSPSQAAHTLDLAWKNDNSTGVVQKVYGGSNVSIRAIAWEAR